MGSYTTRRRLALTRLPEPLRPVAAACLGAFASVPVARFDLARLLLADHVFHRGRYAEARKLYCEVTRAPWAGVARLMTDWIDFKMGVYDQGWPRYPNKGIRPGLRPMRRPEGPVVVADPDRPDELVSGLGLHPWDGAADSGGRPLVWFDWKSSLGGEVLAAQIVRAYLAATGTGAVLAVDPRLVGVIARNFPDCAVVAKTDDLAPLAGQVSGFLLARDVLRRVVRSEADFAAIRAHPFAVAPAPLEPALGDRPNVAFTWKTTNVAQGTYRNLDAGALAAAFRGLGVRFHSAQHGVTPAERDTFRRALGDDVSFDTIDPSAPLETFASQLAAMDRVVTIDNSVLHIAGAFGCPTIGLISVPSYWAWPVGGRDSRWYGSVQLLHQDRAGRWGSVLDELRTMLGDLAEAGR